MNIIEALQNNKEPFGLMSTDDFTNEEMRAKAKEIDGVGVFLIFWTDGEWVERTVSGFGDKLTYRLRADYKEKPSVVECKVAFRHNGLKWCNADNDPVDYIDKAPRNPDFIGFKYEDGGISSLSRLYKLNEGDTQSIHYPVMGEYEVLTPTHVLFEVKS